MKREVTHAIPGGWYGNDPGSIPGRPNEGNVTVDTEAIVHALAWLKRHRYQIIHTQEGPDFGGPRGVLIAYCRPQVSQVGFAVGSDGTCRAGVTTVTM